MISPVFGKASAFFLRGRDTLPTPPGTLKKHVAQIHRDKPNLVISDLMMRDGSGLELRQQIAGLDLPAQPYFIPYLTGYPTHGGTPARPTRHGVDLYLTAIRN